MFRLSWRLLMLTLCLNFASNAAAQVRAAALEFEPKLGEKSANLKRLERDIEKAFKKGAQLVVTPEMATTGYHFFTRDEISSLVEPIPGPTTQRIQKVAARHNGFVVVSLPERDLETNLFYISAALVGPEGVIGKYRKSHPWQQEEFWAARGDLGLPVFDTPIGRIGILICMDIVFAETSSVIAKKGADLLVVPTNSSAQTVSLMQGIAALNQLYVVGANRAGTEKDFHMPGASGIWGPDGRVIARTKTTTRRSGKTRFVFGSFRRRNPRSTRRKPSKVAQLLASYAPLNPNKTNEASWQSVRLIASQFEPADAAERNIETIERQLADLRTHDSTPTLAVFPELALARPTSRSDGKTLAAHAAGLLPRLRSAAKKNRTAVVVGSVVQREGKLYNAAIVIDATGKLVGLHRKTRSGPNDRHWMTTGAALGVFDLPQIGRVGVLLGEEARSADIAAAMAVRRVDIVVVCESLGATESHPLDIAPGLSRNPYPAHSDVRWDALARFSQATTVVANWAGARFFGASGIYGIDPIYGLDRTVTADSRRATTIKQTVDLSKRARWWFNQQHLVTLRRPELYRALLKSD